MAPEQARGKTVDKRADIWSFGAVLYEMLSGRCAFDGETAVEVLGAVIHNDVDYHRLPANLSQSIRMVLRRCLQKDPKERLRDMGDVRLALDGAFMAETPGDDRTRRTRRRGLELVVAACLPAIVGAAAVWWLQDATLTDRHSIRFEIPAPSTTLTMAMAPDGRHVAYIAHDAAGTSWLHVRSLETGDTRQIAQTDRPAFWSPDSLMVAFAAEGKLKRIDLAGGRPVTLCDVGILGGGTWTSDDVITERHVQNPRLSRDGRSVAVIIEGDVWRYDLDGRPPLRLTFDGRHLSPLWTPDGTHVIYEARDGLASVLADGRNEMPEPASPPGHFHPHGWTSDGREIVALLWDFPRKVQDLVRFSPKSTGRIETVLATRADEGIAAAVSPDGRWLAYVSNVTGRNEIWLRAVSGSGASHRVSPDGGNEPVWARDGSELFYIAGTDLMAVSVNLQDTSRYERPVRLFDIASYARSEQPPSYDVSEDGRFLMAETDSPVTTSITVILDWTARLRSTAAH